MANSSASLFPTVEKEVDISIREVYYSKDGCGQVVIHISKGKFRIEHTISRFVAEEEIKPKSVL